MRLSELERVIAKAKELGANEDTDIGIGMVCSDGSTMFDHQILASLEYIRGSKVVDTIWFNAKDVDISKSEVVIDHTT